MRKSNSLGALIMLTALMTSNSINCQSTKGTGPFANRRFNGTDFLGWDNGLGTVAGPLQIRNDIPGQPINFFTGGTERMRITSNGFVGLNNSVPNFHLDIITPERPGGELLF